MKVTWIFVSLLILILMFSILSCSSNSTATSPDNFSLVLYNEMTGVGNFYMVKENRTDVMYLICKSASTSTMTIMFDGNGEPLTYNNWINLNKQVIALGNTTFHK